MKNPIGIFSYFVAFALTGCVHSNTIATGTKTSQAGIETPLSNGEIIYGYRCKGCHEPATPGAPTLQQLSRWKPQAIVDALASGKMKIMTPGMPTIEMREVAVFITQIPLPAKGDFPAVRP